MRTSSSVRLRAFAVLLALGVLLPVAPAQQGNTLFGAKTPRWPRTEKPQLHGKHWVALTGKALGATAGAKIFEQGGNAVDSACAMLAAVCTMIDTLSWGGEVPEFGLRLLE
jgi:hypothetical protein